MNTTQPVINSGDRLCFTAFLAVALHAIIILGIGFSIHQKANDNPVIEVTLAQNPSSDKPKNADYMAQENQVGAGELEEKATPSITETSEFIEQQFQEVSEQTPPEAMPDPQQKQVAQITTLQNQEHRIDNLEQEASELDRLTELDREISLLEKSLALASLDAKLDAREQLKTKDTRIKRVNSVSALKTQDAYYVNQWIKKIHRVGKLNYPEEARRRNIFGSLRLTVVLLTDGSVKEIKILRSSGHKILDDAAVRIVRLAEPFAPFPEHLRLDYDVLEITRTWQFSKDGRSPVL